MINYRSVSTIPVDPEVLVDLPCDTGEGPLWDQRTQTLTWNEIPSGTIFRYDPARDSNVVEFQHDSAVGGHTLQEDGSLVLFCADGKILLVRDGVAETIAEKIDDVVGNRFNDVIAEPSGSILAGTMPLGEDGDGPAHLYRLNTDGSLDLIWDDLALGNGMGFSPEETVFYHSDSNNRVVYRADYDRDSGAISNRDVLIRLDDDIAVPDGMTVDANGDLWVTVWDGSCILHYSADGELIDKVMFPVKKVSSVSFGGHNFETAYVTTAGGSNRAGDDGRLAGSLFSLAVPGVSGKSDFLSRILL